MSEYESPEQRQIRELRNQIYSLNSQNSRQSSENNYLRQQIENIRRQQSVENERVMQQMRAQQERIQQQQRAIQQERVNMSSTIQELDREVRERERLQNEKIVTMREQHARQIDSMNAQFREETEGLRGDIQRVQSDTRRNSEEIQRTQAEMKSRLAELRTETDRKLREQKDDLQRTIISISTKLEEKITSVDAKVQSLVSQMAQKESDAKELSIYWVQEAERLVRELKETYRDSLFDEKRLRRLEQNLRDAQQDIETGHYDSAIKTGRDTFRDAMEMKEDLAALDLEWNYRFNTLRNAEERLLENLDSAEHRVYCIDTNDGTIEYDNGIDYWTNGQLTIIKNRIQKIREKMGNLQNATIDELTTYEQKINSLIEELALVENASHINVAMSLSRFQTAVKIGEILGDEFEMIDSDGDFYCEENREEYHAVYVNPATGDKVVVVITPVSDEAGVVSNHIELIAGNSMDNDIVNRGTIHNVVSAKLREGGIQDMHLERCAGRHGDQLQQVIDRAGDIEAVAAGDERVRVGVPGRESGLDITERIHRGTTY